MTFLRPIPSSNETDEVLAARYREHGDLQLLGDLYGRYMELVHGVCLKYTGDRDDAKDCVLQIFEELTVKLRQHEVANFKSWLYQLAKNHCLMRLRREKKMVKANFDPALMQSEEPLHLNGALEKEARLEQLQLCLETLPDEQRTTIELFYLQGKCYNEIAALTGLEWNRVRSHIQNGRRNLKLCMDKKQTDTIPTHGAERTI